VDLNVGDKVPADIRMVSLKTATMRAIQSSLTGESEPVNKVLEPQSDSDCEIQAKTSMLFAGTAIANGHCQGEESHQARSI
jgi:Ca2+-transporting ATPase